MSKTYIKRLLKCSKHFNSFFISSEYNIDIKNHSDKDIVKMEGEGNESSIRNHRFKLRENKNNDNNKKSVEIQMIKG
jgi:hypothetical protein